MASPENPLLGLGAILKVPPKLAAGCVFTVAQIFNLPHRRFVIGRTLLGGESWQVKNLRYSAAQPSRNQNGPRLWSKTQPQRVGMTAVLRLVLRTQPRSEKSSRLATIPGDTDKLQVCATAAASTLNTNGWLPLE